MNTSEDDPEMINAIAMRELVTNLAQQLEAMKALINREQPAPIVNVTNEVRASDVLMPTQPAPVVNVVNQVSPTPVTVDNVVNVSNPDRKVTLDFKRNSAGDISKATGTSEAQ